jgi:WD40 repeat protein
VAFHPSQPLLALAPGIGSKEPSSVLLLDGEGKPVAMWTERDQTAVALSWSPDGERLAVAYHRGSSEPSGEVCIRQFPMGQPIHGLSLPDGSVLHKGDIQVVRYSEDGRFLATAGGDGLVHLWDARTHALLRTFQGHTAGVTTLTFAPQDRLISASLDTTVRAWELSTGRQLFVRRGHEAAVRCVAVAPGPKGIILSGGEDAFIYAWRSEQLQESEGYALHEGAVTSLAFSPQSGHLISVGQDGAVWQTDPTKKAPPRRLREEKRPLHYLRFVPGSDTCLLAGGAAEPGGDGKVRVLDAKDGSVLAELPTGLLESSHLSVTRDGEWVSVVGRTPDRNTVVQVWNLFARRKDHEFKVPGATAALLYQGGKSLFVLVDTMQAHAGMPDPVQVREADRVEYDLSTGERVRSPSRGFPGMRFATLSADERYLLIGGRWQAVTIDRPARTGGTTYRSLWGHSAAIQNAVFNPEETLFATASEDESIRVWDFESGLELLALRGDPCSMNDVAFHPTGEFLAGTQANGTVRIWDGRPRGAGR